MPRYSDIEIGPDGASTIAVRALETDGINGHLGIGSFSTLMIDPRV
ncbi:hypothetical protein [Dongia sp.]